MPMIQMPTAISDGSWIRLAATGAARASRPSATAARERRGPPPDDEGEQRHLEQERLELPGALCHDDRDEHREGHADSGTLGT